MATATAVEIKRAADQAEATRQLAEINARLERIEAALAALVPSEQSTPPRGRAVRQPVAS